MANLYGANGEFIQSFDTEGEALMYAAMNGISPFSIGPS